jgi:type I restriction enzyme S subunit
MPPLPEQEKIAAVLWKIQRAIELEARLARSFRELKKAAMRQLFTAGLRGEPQKETAIGLVPETWDVVPLESLGRIGNGSTPKRTNPAYWLKGTIPWLTSGKIHEGTITSPDQFVTELALQECHLPMVKAGSVLVAITGQGKTLGNAALVTFDTCISQHLAFIQSMKPNVLPPFVMMFLQSRYEEIHSAGQSGGSTKGALTCSFLRSYRIPLPTIDEQEEIVEILGTLDRKIAVHDAKQQAWQDLFKTMLHKLMTAQIRVNDLDIATREFEA